MKEAINNIFKTAERMVNIGIDYKRGLWEDQMVLKQIEESVISMQQELQGLELETCICGKCGEIVQCWHEGTGHIKSLCGKCI